MTKNVVCFAIQYFFLLKCDFFMKPCLWDSLWHLQAEEIAEKLCESVAASLEGKKLASFTRVSSTVQVCVLDHICFLFNPSYCHPIVLSLFGKDHYNRMK